MRSSDKMEMISPETRRDCPMRGASGNCLPVGGFCADVVSNEICEVIHNAYQHGYSDALALLKEQEPVEPILEQDFMVCGNCGHEVIWQKIIGDNILVEEQLDYCPQCGKAVKWE